MTTKVLWMFLNIKKNIVKVLDLDEQEIQNHVILITQNQMIKLKEWDKFYLCKI